MSDVPSARDFLNSVADWQDDPNGTPSAADRPAKIGTVDAAYAGGRAKVRFDGETTTGTRTYVAVCTLRPGDRVILLPVGRTFVIVGVIDSAPGSDLPAGASISGYWTVAPAGFLLEDGTVQVRATYPSLYSTIGTTFNTGGETSLQFRLPDSRGRVQVDKGAGAFTVLGAKNGEEAHLLTAAEIPAHTHPFGYSGSPATDYANWGLATTTFPGAGSVAMAQATASTTALISIKANTGGDGAHNNIQPSIVVLRCIKF